ncbi:MAG: hypothetical protein IKO90_11135 [Bacteroidales bacterium]|nr:hypothetical protein [Bacteroidales bacterium]
MKRTIIYIFLIFTQVSLCCYMAMASEEPSSDTTKEEVIKDIFQWQYNATHTERYRVDIDTSMDFFYLYEPNGSIADFSVDIAGYASPSFSLLVNPYLDEHFSLRAYEKSIVTTDDMCDYTAQRPYSYLFYSQGMNSEQSGKFRHTQNINKYANVGFDLNYYKKIGEYDNQAIKGRHVTPWISYYGPRFTTVFKYAFNSINRQENGGIAADSLLNYEKLLRMKYPRAASTLKYQDLDFMQKWNLGRKPKEDSTSLDLMRYRNAFGYRMHYTSVKRFYSDENPDTAFYKNVYYDSTATNDTLFCKNLNWALFFEFQRSLKKIEIVANFAFVTDYTSSRFYDYNYTIPEYFDRSRYYEGTFDVSLPYSITLSHRHAFYFNKEDQNHYNFSTELSKSFNILNKESVVQIGQDFSNDSPPDEYIDYETNNYLWHNDFNDVKIHDIYADFSTLFGNVEATVHYYQLQNYVSLDEKGVLTQIDGSGSAFSAKLMKTTRFWHILMRNGLIFQKMTVGTQEYPKWATYNSLAFHGAFLRKLIQVQLGADMLYYPAYNTPTYDAALGTFLPQTDFQYGDFPIMNVFASLKYKPIRLYVKYTDFYSLLKGRNYPIAGYPQTKGSISFGLSWMFYN